MIIGSFHFLDRGAELWSDEVLDAVRALKREAEANLKRMLRGRLPRKSADIGIKDLPQDAGA